MRGCTLVRGVASPKVAEPQAHPVTRLAGRGGDRLSLDFSQRRQGRAGGRSRCEATERRGVRSGREAAEQLQKCRERKVPG